MIVVIGAGIVGLSIAYELVKRGADVRVLEASDSASAASWSGAGRLAPFTDSEGDEDLEMFLATALGVYQIFVGELHKRTGIDPHLRIDGIVNIAHDEAAVVRLRNRAQTLVARGIHAHWLEPDEVNRIEPFAGPRTLGASLIEDEGQIDTRQLGAALRYACTDAGVRIEEHAGRVALAADDHRVIGVTSGSNLMLAEAVVNAAGPWAGELEGVPPHVRIGVTPRKGQIVVLAMPQRRVTRLVYVPGAYLIPRTDGTLVIGETSADAGFDVTVDPEATRCLLEAAIRAFPSLADFETAETWAGLRPATPNGRPFIGSTELEGYFVAAGHQHGILLAPATALAIANLVEGKTVHAEH
jgi:glycine oxidase